MSKMRRVVIMQARMTSSRLPGKVLMEVAGRPMLVQQLRRLKQCREVQDIVVATTTNAADDAVTDVAHREGVRFFRGSEADVLSRFVGAAKEAKADVVVRVTADCPLMDPQVTDRVILELVDHADECDYASNVLRRTYPQGLDVEAFFCDVLLRMDRLARSQLAREHVTVVLRSERSGVFLCRSVEDTQNNADMRWTVDTPEDLEFVRRLYAALDLGEQQTSHREIIDYLRGHIDLMQINAGIKTWEPPVR